MSITGSGNVSAQATTAQQKQKQFLASAAFLPDSKRPESFFSRYFRAWKVHATASGVAGTVISAKGPGFLQRANSNKLKEIFDKYASKEIDGEGHISAKSFVQDYLGIFTTSNNEKAIKLIGGIIDTSKDGWISFGEFQTFEGLLCSPDALYKIAFQLFDTRGSGSISFTEFAEVIKQTELHSRIPFNFNGSFVQNHFGGEKHLKIPYLDFTQFLHDFHEEYAVEAFRQFDPAKSGFIGTKDFHTIMLNIKSHLLTKDVESNLMTVLQKNQATRQASLTTAKQVSFPYFMAFNSLLNQMELIKKIYLQASNGSRQVQLTKEEFLHSAQMMSQITPLEIDILYQLTDSIRSESAGRIRYTDLESIAPEQYYKKINQRFQLQLKYSSKEDRGVISSILESTYRFTLGATAGAVGATAVYPIDLVKTRMQNQRAGSFIGELMYKSSWDCLKKVIRHEGFAGLYRGLLPQFMGVAPEKAIKLTVNDFVRDKFMNRENNKSQFIPIWGEVLAGAMAGGSQVVFTNPLEIIKIRLQVAGEIIATSGKVSAFSVIKELGLFGLYKGAQACFLRDVPFSAIYFPTYAHTKVKFQDENGYNSPISLLVSGAISGIPAASLVTPADVIKTRLQVVARAGQTTYSGVFDAARKIYAEEGGYAFWKGTGARVLRSSPQFGVTLVTYELLQRYLYVDFGGTRPTGSEAKVQISSLQDIKSQNPDHIGGYEVALPIMSGIESKFGISFAKTLKIDSPLSPPKVSN